MTDPYMRLLKIGLGTALALALVLAPGGSRADKAEIMSTFSSLGKPRGWARLNVWSNQAYLHLGLERLAPNATYELQANGVPQTRLTTNGRGEFQGFFYLFPEDGREPALYLDPRGKLLTVVDRKDRAELGMVFSGPLEPAGIRVDELVDLDPSRRAPEKGRARAEFHRGANGRSHLEVSAAGLPRGETHFVLVDGQTRAWFQPGNLGYGQARMDDPPDPRGKTVELLDSRGRVVFSDDLAAEIPGADTGAPSRSRTPVQFTVRLPGFADRPAVALRLWRREPDQSRWEPVASVFLWPAEFGSPTVRYSFIDPATGGVDTSREVEVPAHWAARGALTFPLRYRRPGGEAFFKVSALNVVGESRRSQNAVLR